MLHGLSCERSQPVKNINHGSWQQNVRHRINNSLLLAHALSQIYPIHAFILFIKNPF
jgi:hypothetical protein